MHRRARLAVLAVVVVLALFGAIAAYALDASNAGRIADGVRVGDIELGGLETKEARRLLRDELVVPREVPVRVRAGSQTFRLSADALEVRAPLRAMVAEAQAVSRADALPSRLWRYATGSEIEHRIEPRVSYSEAAVKQFVIEVANSLNRAPQNATVAATTSSLEVVEGKPGRSLRSEQLEDQVLSAVEAGRGPVRVDEAQMEPVAPDVAAEDLAASYPSYITVDRENFKLRYFENLELRETYSIAVGQQGYDTPTGLYTVESKQLNPTWYVPDSDWAGELAGTTVPPGPDNPLKARWMGFSGAAGIHGTDDLASLGGAASRGCVRMAVADVIELYERVEVGTPVFIE